MSLTEAVNEPLKIKVGDKEYQAGQLTLDDLAKVEAKIKEQRIKTTQQLLQGLTDEASKRMAIETALNTEINVFAYMQRPEWATYVIWLLIHKNDQSVTLEVVRDEIGSDDIAIFNQIALGIVPENKKKVKQKTR